MATVFGFSQAIFGQSNIRFQPLSLYDMSGKLIQTATINQGSTIWYLDVRTLYSGQYILSITDGANSVSKALTIHN